MVERMGGGPEVEARPNLSNMRFGRIRKVTTDSGDTKWVPTGERDKQYDRVEIALDTTTGQMAVVGVVLRGPEAKQVPHRYILSQFLYATTGIDPWLSLDGLTETSVYGKKYAVGFPTVRKDYETSRRHDGEGEILSEDVSNNQITFIPAETLFSGPSRCTVEDAVRHTIGIGDPMLNRKFIFEQDFLEEPRGLDEYSVGDEDSQELPKLANLSSYFRGGFIRGLRSGGNRGEQDLLYDDIGLVVDPETGVVALVGTLNDIQYIVDHHYNPIHALTDGSELSGIAEDGVIVSNLGGAHTKIHSDGTSVLAAATDIHSVVGVPITPEMSGTTLDDVLSLVDSYTQPDVIPKLASYLPQPEVLVEQPPQEITLGDDTMLARWQMNDDGKYFVEGREDDEYDELYLGYDESTQRVGLIGRVGADDYVLDFFTGEPMSRETNFIVTGFEDDGILVKIDRLHFRIASDGEYDFFQAGDPSPRTFHSLRAGEFLTERRQSGVSLAEHIREGLAYTIGDTFSTEGPNLLANPGWYTRPDYAMDSSARERRSPLLIQRDDGMYVPEGASPDAQGFDGVHYWMDKHSGAIGLMGRQGKHFVVLDEQYNVIYQTPRNEHIVGFTPEGIIIESLTDGGLSLSLMTKDGVQPIELEDNDQRLILIDIVDEGSGRMSSDDMLDDVKKRHRGPVEPTFVEFMWDPDAASEFVEAQRNVPEPVVPETGLENPGFVEGDLYPEQARQAGMMSMVHALRLVRDDPFLHGEDQAQMITDLTSLLVADLGMSEEAFEEHLAHETLELPQRVLERARSVLYKAVVARAERGDTDGVTLANLQLVNKYLNVRIDLAAQSGGVVRQRTLDGEQETVTPERTTKKQGRLSQRLTGSRKGNNEGWSEVNTTEGRIVTRRVATPDVRLPQPKGPTTPLRQHITQLFATVLEPDDVVVTGEASGQGVSFGEGRKSDRDTELQHKPRKYDEYGG